MSAANTLPGVIVSAPAAGGNGGATALMAGSLTGLTMYKSGDAVVTVRSGRCRDDADTLNLVLGAPTPVNFSVVGINGADAAIANAHAIIYMYIVGGTGQPTGMLVSESATGATLPAGYTAQRFLGSIPIEAGEGPVQVDWMQQGAGLSRTVRLGPESVEESLVGGPWSTVAGAIPSVTSSASWRNIVAGGVDVQFDPAERMPARPVGVGGTNSPRGIRGIFQILTRQNVNDFIEFAPADGVLEAPASSPPDGFSNARVYNIASNQTIELILQVGENQTLQYRSTAGNGEYLVAIVGWIDELDTF